MNKIVLIDDDLTMLEALKSSFEARDYEVFKADNGIDGLRLIREHLPDVVICDYKMEVMNGLEVARGMQIEPSTSKIPFILISAYADKQALMRHGSNVNALVEKPFTEDEIVKVVDDARLDPPEE